MHYVGKLDKEIYRVITDDIATDEVVITEKQVLHIMERHPNDYERYFKYIDDIINVPDYIVEGNRPNTALVLKNVSEAGKNFQLILRLKTSGDDPRYKNSIITFLKIKDKEWKRLINNKKILYKRE